MALHRVGAIVGRRRVVFGVAALLVLGLGSAVAWRGAEWYRDRQVAQPGLNPYVELPWSDTATPGLAAMPEPGAEPRPDLTGQYRWQQRPVGGGGWVTGLEVHPSRETVLSRGDLGGVFRWDDDDQRWRQLLVHDNVLDPVMSDYLVEAIAIAPSDADVLYVSGGDSDEPTGRVLRSDDGGASWVAGAERFAIGGNRELRQGGERLSVSPQDPRHVWLATRREGLFRSTDGAITWQPVPEVPTGTWSPEEPAGNPWTLVTEEAGREVVYVAVNGDGVHRGEPGGAWEQVVAIDGVPFDAELGPDGRLWVTELGTSTVWRWDPDTGQAVAVDVGIDEARVVAVDPTDGDRVIVMSHQQVRRSTDGGESWDRLGLRFSCPEAPWLDEYDFSFFLGASSPEFDPVDAGGLWFPQGFGVWYADAGDGDRLDFRCRTLGFEELATNDLVVTSSGALLTAHWDRALFLHTSFDESGARQGPEERFNSAWDLDQSPSDPDVVVGVIADHRLCCEEDGRAYNSGWTADGGRTWNRFGSYEDDHPDELRFGNIAAAADDVDNLVWLPSFNGALHTSSDRGDTWTRVELPGTETMVNSATGRWQGGSHHAVFLHRQVVAADRVLPATFYVYHAELGVFRSTDGGTDWTLVSDDSLPSGWAVGWFNAQLKTVPGAAGHLYFTPGELFGQLFPLYESTDGGETWEPLPQTSNVGAMGFGAPLVEGGPPTLFVAGRIDGRRGVWRTPAGSREWELVSPAPGGNYSEIYSLAGDPTVPGRVYVGFRGSGVQQGDAP